jgi:succinate-acetate transporter protein
MFKNNKNINMNQENNKIEIYIKNSKKIIKYLFYFLLLTSLVLAIFDNSNTNAWWVVYISFFVLFLLFCLVDFINKIINKF